jgi:5-methylcytosine-specific restriction enzyme subunit McrC
VNSPSVLELREYEEISIDPSEIREEYGEYLHREYGDKVSVEPPSFKTDQKWVFKSQGFVGFIPIAEDLGISLQPKVELGNLFRMLEYAYNLKINFFEGVTQSESLRDFYERLANVLAKRVLDRARRGVYRTYLDDRDQLPYLRGTLDVRSLLRRPWEVKLACEFQEHTADIEENQLLTWTLRKIVRSGACSERVLPTARKAYRSIQSFASLQPFSPEACVGRLYNRLNDDYQPMHALCRFFLENTGPTHRLGDRDMLPFLVNMANLFERFVARWLEGHKPPDLGVQAQEHVHIGDDHDLQFRIDLVITDEATGQAKAVLDTKYKKAEKPAEGDVQQVVAYAVAKRCREAILVYPRHLPRPLDERVGDIRVRTAVFSLDGDIERNGEVFLKELDSLSVNQQEASN